METKLSDSHEFLNLSNGFKKVFLSPDAVDQKKLRFPIAGYAGHRRGERSQNFFGKGFREATFLSKRLQRDL
jgi:hypothetical protein